MNRQAPNLSRSFSSTELTADEQALLANFPSDWGPKYFSNVAHQQVKNKNYEQARQVYKAGILKFPNNEQLLFAYAMRCIRSTVQEKEENTDKEAIQAFQKLIAINTTHVLAHVELARLLSRQGRTEESRQIHFKLLSFQDEDYRAYTSLAETYEKDGFYNRARSCLKRAFQIVSDNTEMSGDQLIQNRLAEIRSLCTRQEVPADWQRVLQEWKTPPKPS